MKSVPLPFGNSLPVPHLPTVVPNRKILSKLPRITLCTTMSDPSDPTKPTSQNALQTPQNYPVPLSPPVPSIPKDIELTRAMSASSKSSLFSISRTDFVNEDEWLVAVGKPQGIYCESVFDSVRKVLCDSSEPGRLGTKVSPPELHLANRLDRDTSGLMLITKSHKAASKLVKAFTNHKVSKTYIAFCIGSATKWENITIKSGHGRLKFGAWRVYAASDVGRTLPGGSVVRDMENIVRSVDGKWTKGLQRAFPIYEDNVIVVEEKAIVDRDGKKDEILVRARPKSGRPHQIRLHCQ